MAPRRDSLVTPRDAGRCNIGTRVLFRVKLKINRLGGSLKD